MAHYKINFNKKSRKKLDSMSDNIVMPILIAIENLAKNRIRVGNYRIIYEIFDEILLIDVIHLGHRKDIYE